MGSGNKVFVILGRKLKWMDSGSEAPTAAVLWWEEAAENMRVVPYDSLEEAVLHQSNSCLHRWEFF